MTDPVNPYLVPDGHVIHVAGAPGGPNTPTPPNVGLQREAHVPGSYADLSDGQGVLDDEVFGSPQRWQVTPVPLIGAIDFGGTVSQASQWSPTVAGASITIGDSGNGRPQNLQIILWSDGATPLFEIVGDGLKDQPGNGAKLAIWLNSPALVLPLKRVTVRSLSATPGNLNYIVIAYPVAQ